MCLNPPPHANPAEMLALEALVLPDVGDSLDWDDCEAGRLPLNK